MGRTTANGIEGTSGTAARWYLEGPARRVVGGTSSPARSTREMGAMPVVVHHGRGARVWDVDGRVYLDYLQAFGPGILGHGHPGVVCAAEAVTAAGPLYGTHHPSEGRLAEALHAAIPGLERMRFVASGTEAVMSAIRLARAATGRTRVVKFDAGYHGHSDPVLGDTGSAAAHAYEATESRGVPDGADASAVDQRMVPAGVPRPVVQDTVTLPWNDAVALDAFLRAEGTRVACVLVEPIAGNIGIVPPDPAFVAAVNRAHAFGALVVADEVVSGFRFRYGDASGLVGLRPDLYCLGKIVGGGFPVGVFGGRNELMAEISPEGPVFQAGTYAGHPVAMSAGAAALFALGQPGVYGALQAKAERLAEGLAGTAADAGVAVTVSRVTTAFTVWPGRQPEPPVHTLADVERTDSAAFAAMYRGFLEEGVLLAPSRYEAWFVTTAHTYADIDDTLARAERVWPQVRRALMSS